MDVHKPHSDYLPVTARRMLRGRCDLRRESATDAPRPVSPPRMPSSFHPAVAHGFYFHEPSLHVYAVSEYWDPGDELACNWADPELGIDWPAPTALVSDRDRDAQPLRALLAELAPLQPL